MQGRWTPIEVQNIMQAMTMQIIGTTDFSLVRINWPTNGQPAWKVTDDRVFIGAVQVDDDYGTVRDIMPVSDYDDTHVQSISTYVRVWEVNWCCVGPNGFDAAANIKSALYNPAFLDSLSLQSLTPITNFGVPVRAPEVYMGQWWERVDFTAKFNELVTEQYIVQSIGSADIILEKENGIKIEFTVGE